MEGIYEELIPVKNLKEIEKQYLPDSLSEKEKITYIITKGFPIQKLAIINRIPYYSLNKELLEITIRSILEYIEIWEENFQINFAQAINKTFSRCENTDIVYESFADIVTSLVKFCMKIISTENENVAREFHTALTSLVNFYAENKKIKLENDLAEYTCALGSFGKSLTSKKFCVFFCSCLIQVFSLFILEICDSFPQDVYNRFMILASDNELKIEIAQNFQFIFREFLSDKFVKQTVLKKAEELLLEDDFAIKSQILFHVLINLKKINDDSYVTTFVNKISNFLDFCFLSGKFWVIKKFFVFMVTERKIKNFAKIIKNIVKKYMGLNIIAMTENFDLIIENFFNIFLLFQNSDYSFICDILAYICKHIDNLKIKVIENFQIILKPALIKEDIISLNHFMNKLFSVVDFKEKNSFANFTKNLCQLSPYLHYEGLTNFLVEKFDFIIDQASLSLVQLKSEELINFLKFLRKSESIYKTKSQLTEKVFSLISSIIITSNSNNGLSYSISVIESAIRVLPILIKTSENNKNKQIYKFIFLNFIESESFYTKRHFFPFFKQMSKVFSFSYLKQCRYIEALFGFFIDCEMIKILLLKAITSIYPLLEDEPDLLSIIESNIENTKLSTKDKELIMAITYFENFQKSYKSSLSMTDILSRDAEKFKSEQAEKNQVKKTDEVKKIIRPFKKQPTKIISKESCKKIITISIKKSNNHIGRTDYTSLERKIDRETPIIKEFSLERNKIKTKKESTSQTVKLKPVKK